MDVLSHALWGAAAARTKNEATAHASPRPVSVWWAAFWGAFPDLFAFAGPFAWTAIVRLSDHQLPPVGASLDVAANGPGSPGAASIALPLQIASGLYDYSHSLVVFLLVAAVAWAARRRPPWVLAGWPLHIVMDIPGHTASFFPTPVFWPLSAWRYDGVPWSDPRVYVPNVLGLAAVYAWLAWRRKRRTAAGSATS